MQAVAAQGTDVPIAVIGMAARAAGAPDLAGLWRLLAHGQSTFTEVPADRLPGLESGWVGESRPQAALLDRLDTFDAEFFGISPRQAAFLDPRQRILLEETWHALEDAGLAPDRLAGSNTGVFTGSSGPDFRQRAADLGAMDQYTAPGTGEAFLANRISYHFDWHGTSLQVDTACSAGLTAVCQALWSLASGQVDLAVAAGVSVICHGYSHAAYHMAGLLSPTGNVSLFSDAADGYVRGEGAAVVVLKRLVDAQRDGDPVRAVILGAAQSHDGRAGGQFAPDPDVQASLIRHATERAGVSAGLLGYIEAHATGTQAGDLAEAKGVIGALAGTTAAAGPGGRLWLGSAKANIGHTEGAAGVFGLVKAVLVLENEQIPPIPGFTTPMAGIPVDAAPIAFPASQVPWPGSASARRLAGVSSFGIGGANAHLVVAEAAASVPATAGPGSGRWLFPLSAASPAALASLAAGFAGWLDEHPGADLGAVAWTLQTGRRHLAHRAVLVGSSTAELTPAARTLAGHAIPAPADSVPATAAQAIGDFLTGQGVDWPALWHDPDGLRRIPLVPYPFEPHSHWLRAEPPPALLAPRPAPVWPESPRPQQPQSAAATPATGPAPTAGPIPAAGPEPAAGPAPAERPAEAVPLVRLRPPADYGEPAPVPAPSPAPAAQAPEPAPAAGAAGASQPPPASREAAPVHLARVPDVSPPHGSGTAGNGAGAAALEEIILTTITEVLYLGIGEIGPDDDFIAAGLDSILAVEFVQLLRDRAGTELAAKQLYETRTARALAREVLRGVQPAEPDHAAAPGPPPAANGATAASQDLAAEVELDRTAHETLAARLRAMVGECLYLPADSIEPDAEFTVMGLDSVLAVEFVSRVKTELGAPLTVEALRDHPTVAQLSRHLITSVPELAGGLAR
jgi:acyl transferase domain-containing protein